MKESRKKELLLIAKTAIISNELNEIIHLSIYFHPLNPIEFYVHNYIPLIHLSPIALKVPALFSITIGFV